MKGGVMRVADVVGVVLLGAVVVGGVVVFVKMRPIQAGAPAGNGGTVSVVPTAQGYQYTNQTPRDQTAADVTAWGTAILGVAGSLIQQGAFDSLWN